MYLRRKLYVQMIYVQMLVYAKEILIKLFQYPCWRGSERLVYETLPSGDNEKSKLFYFKVDFFISNLHLMV